MDLLSEENVQCPHCWETFSILVDRSVEHQNYVEDCFVCCRPIVFDVHCSDDHVSIEALREDD